jgi:hypothetical protein
MLSSRTKLHNCSSPLKLKRPKLSRRPRRLRVESLERRELLSFLVTNTDDTGPGSLRTAIENANRLPTSTDIFFEISAKDRNFLDVDGDRSGDVFVINLNSPLPQITNRNGVAILGNSQTTHTGNSNETGPEVVVNAQRLGIGTSVFDFQSDDNRLTHIAIENAVGNALRFNGDHNVVSDTFVGVKPDGVSAAGGGNGVVVIGNDNSIERNVFAFNASNAIQVQSGERNSLRSNRFFGNGNRIELGRDGANANDLQDVDTGSNQLQNFPQLLSHRTWFGVSLVSAQLNSVPNSEFTIEYHGQLVADAPPTFFDSQSVTTNAAGVANFTFAVPDPLGLDYFYQGLAIDSDGNTSEFSSAIRLPELEQDSITGGGPYRITAGDSLRLNAATSAVFTQALWDLDNDGQYDDADGLDPIVPWERLIDLALATEESHKIGIALETPNGPLHTFADLFIENATPTIEDIEIVGDLFEGEEITLRGRIVDPGDDFWMAKVRFPDTTIAQQEVAADGLFEFKYTAADEIIGNFTLKIRDALFAIATEAIPVAIENRAPLAELSIDPIRAFVDDLLTATVQVSDPGDDRVDLRLDFGDGSPVLGNRTQDSAEFAFEHRYSAPGSYNVVATATDEDGSVTITQQMVSVENVIPTVAISVDSDQLFEGNFVRGEVIISDSSNESWRLAVDYGDGLSQTFDTTTPAHPFNHRYRDNGEYAILWTATDESGATTTQSQTIRVQNVAPIIAVDGFPVSLSEGDWFQTSFEISDFGLDSLTAQVELNGVPFGPVQSVENGSVHELEHRFLEAGDYQFKIIGEDDDGGRQTIQLPVKVKNIAPSIQLLDNEFVIREGESIQVPLEITDRGDSQWTLVAESEGKIQTWESSSTTTGFSSWTFDEAGQYLIDLRITDDDAASQIRTLRVLVENIVPAINLPTSWITIWEGENYVVPISIDDAGDSNWNVAITGPGTSIEMESTTDLLDFETPALSNAGTYEFAFTVTDDDGDSSRGLVSIHVVNHAPVTSLVSPPNNQTRLLEGEISTLQIDIDDPGDVEWLVSIDFGDGSPNVVFNTISESLTIPHRYVDVGDFDVSITISDDDQSTARHSAIVSVASIAPILTVVGEASTYFENEVFRSLIRIERTVTDTVDLAIDFGDGTPLQYYQSLNQPTLLLQHRYTNVGQYQISIVAIDDDDDSVEAQTLAEIGNMAPALQLNTGATTITLGEMFSSNIFVTDPGQSPLDVRIDFGDGKQYLAKHDSNTKFDLDHMFSTPGTYEVMAVGTDQHGASSTQFTTVVVEPMPLPIVAALPVPTKTNFTPPNSVSNNILNRHKTIIGVFPSEPLVQVSIDLPTALQVQAAKEQTNAGAKGQENDTEKSTDVADPSSKGVADTSSTGNEESSRNESDARLSNSATSNSEPLNESNPNLVAQQVRPGFTDRPQGIHRSQTLGNSNTSIPSNATAVIETPANLGPTNLIETSLVVAAAAQVAGPVASLVNSINSAVTQLIQPVVNFAQKALSSFASATRLSQLASSVDGWFRSRRRKRKVKRGDHRDTRRDLIELAQGLNDE